MSHPPPYPSQPGAAQPEMPDTGSPNGFSGHYRHGAQLAHTAEAIRWNSVPPANPTCAVSLFAFVVALAVELSFVLGMVVLAKVQPAHAVGTAGATTAISVAGFYSRNSIVTIGKRLIGTAEYDKQ